MRTQQAIIDSLPKHLQQYVSVQDYSQYTARDQAGWRFLMRNLSRRLRGTAHEVYQQGLHKTGISLDYIPKLDEMNQQLGALGWSALAVDGFLPPHIFMEFQARRILVIAVAMRRTEHLLYTPAPDIVHESAGHAPFLADVDYAEFLQRFGELGMRALHTRQDTDVYEAIRELSEIKEDSGATAQQIAEAEERVLAASAAIKEPSEAALLSRLHWWTVEYGLVGELDDYRIFGAGLLSSLQESSHCLNDDEVVKLPLTLGAIDHSYDITSPQPQLFVTKSCRHLSQVLEHFAAGMAFTKGGALSAKKAIDCQSLATLQLDTGLQISGQPSALRCDAMGNEIYINTLGPTQLAFQGSQLHGHGTQSHPQGFGSPLGLVKNISRCLSTYTVDELAQLGIVHDKALTLEFVSGITVHGVLTDILRADRKNLVLSFANCTVTAEDGSVLFQPEWGVFDMAVGLRVESVFGGSADRSSYMPNPEAPAVKPKANISLIERNELDVAYQSVSQLDHDDANGAEQLYLAIQRDFPEEWLLLIELLQQAATSTSLASIIKQQLEQLSATNEAAAEAIYLELESVAL